MGNKKWVYLGIMIASGSAFMIDRLFLSEPAPAAAEVAPRAAAARPAGKPSSPRDESPPPVADPSLEYLMGLSDVPATRNIFSPTTQMLMHYQMLQAAVSPPEAGPPEGSPEAFETAHRLQATMVGPDALLAVVDGRPLRLGAVLDGYRLTRIETQRATFRKGRDRATLELPIGAF